MNMSVSARFMRHTIDRSIFSLKSQLNTWIPGMTHEEYPASKVYASINQDSADCLDWSNC